jgi:integrase/recombinase XerD
MKEKSHLDEYVEWLAVEKGRSLATIESYERDIRSFLAWMVEERTAVAQIGEGDLDRYFSELKDARLAVSSISRARSSIRGWFGYLVDEGILKTDPSLRLKGTRRGRTLPKPLAEDQIMALLDSLPSATALDLRDRALLELLYGTGVRVSEATGIDLEHLDFDEGLILVTGKGSKQRLVPMGGAVRRSLNEYLGAGGRERLILGRPSSRLFLNARGSGLSRQGVDLIINKRAIAAGIGRNTISAHVFRHSCATHMLAHGADIRIVQELLGHASIATTQIYTAVSVTSLQHEYNNAHPRAND